MKKLAKGFTLIELMIVVAIIGILAAIAIPNFVKYQLRSKFSEASSNIEGLRKAEEALRQGERRIVIGAAAAPVAGFTPGTYWNLGAVVFPGNTVGSAKLTWTGGAGGQLERAAAMDWQIEGATYFNYEVSVAGVAVTGFTESGTGYYAGASADIDADGVKGLVALVKPNLAGASATATTNAPGFPGTLGSCAGGVLATPCTITGPDVF